MSKVTTRINGNTIYDSFSAEEIRAAQALARRISFEVPAVEEKLIQKYGPKMCTERAFELGQFLGSMLESEGIQKDQRTLFWEEIKSLSAKTNEKDARGKNKKRSRLEYCYLISRQEHDVACKFTWRQWNDFFDRSSFFADNRFLVWASKQKFQSKDDDFRSCLVLLTCFVNKTDPSVLTDEEVFKRFDRFKIIIDSWHKLFMKYFDNKRKNLSAARNERYRFYLKSYLRQAFESCRLTEESRYFEKCELVFRRVYVDIDSSGNFNKN